MGLVIFFMFLALSVSLIFSLYKTSKNRKFFRFFRWGVAVLSILLLSYWFFQNSIPKLMPDTLALQVINKLSQPVDFYLIKRGANQNVEKGNFTKHIGEISPKHYRLEYINVDNSDELWLVGYIGKKNLVYFSQRSIQNKEIDQIIEINNYINQSQKLSEEAKKIVLKLHQETAQKSIWISLCYLLLFMNIVLLLRKNK